MPQLFVATGATKWNDPRNFPWTMGWQPNYQSEGQIYAKYILKNLPDAKIAVLYQNDDYGKDYVKGLKDGLGAKAASMIVAEDSYETTEPTIDSHIVKLKASGADVFFDVTIPKFAAQAIKKIAEIEWKPLHFLNNVSLVDQRHHQAGRLRRTPRASSPRPISRIRPTRNGRTMPDMKALERIPGQVLSRSQSHRCQRDLRLCRRADHGACAEGSAETI